MQTFFCLFCFCKLSFVVTFWYTDSCFRWIEYKIFKWKVLCSIKLYEILWSLLKRIIKFCESLWWYLQYQIIKNTLREQHIWSNSSIFIATVWELFQLPQFCNCKWLSQISSQHPTEENWPPSKKSWDCRGALNISSGSNWY